MLSGGSCWKRPACKASLETQKKKDEQEDEEEKEEDEEETICSAIVLKFINIAECFRVFHGCQRTSAGGAASSHAEQELLFSYRK